MRPPSYYEQMRNYAIAVEIMADPTANSREKVLAQRIVNRDRKGANGLHNERNNPDHNYD